jgi:hypothetical protein
MVWFGHAIRGPAVTRNGMRYEISAPSNPAAAVATAAGLGAVGGILGSLFGGDNKS